ncbi:MULTISPECIES: hypothetical protein [Bizionia]|uniref:DUF1795 domain-containing protein n=1 Tax=Bizionia algoritergicola TaxID=291187 RepID=A0A5D0QLX1_9FLAO|nr:MULTISPECIES: hypothetical protein [Bizionia]OBX17541.1 hypothetical protein BAA08_16155 [Bizionia sp. APA-3]TYB69418.1 hypothetical protein ES675_16210 [Bizionia algoritergicola]
MKFIGKFIVLILIVSCSNKETTLEQYANYPVKFAKQKINYPTNDFLIFIPKNWEWKVESYDNENIILGIDVSSKPDKDGFIDMISIQKIKSFGENKDLKSEFDYCLNIIENNSQKRKIIESGFTEILNQKSYFLHTKSDTDKYGETEIISFILDSGIEGVFYNLTASASQTRQLKKNMSILVQSLKTFEKLNK